ncbi:aspartate--tRNA(Asn) ligase [Candidatus Falkowbacteria bacterium]|jgi:nondiscriminating aspartyl-tRNA synthetase|nr:aspartate--tRNA(Asn) ligase [Candidatus Falkowbacteria bacterium]MBT7007738.1 aspartate--tRNA(Asn) ligase [Candidatus Falkowbacteria bacterium]
MERTINTHTATKIGEEITVKGWVNARRNMGKIAFLDMRDRTGILQTVVVPAELDNASKDLVEGIRPEYVLEIKGIVQERGEKQKNDLMATGTVELLAKEIKVLAEAQTLPYELGSDIHMDTYLENLPFNLRSEKATAVFKIQSALIAGYRKKLDEKDFTEFQCPKIVAMATEGGANVFNVDYFGHKAYLAQSPQFYKQKMVSVFERVYTTGSVYRAEEHDTNRHINEYTSLDFEMGFIKNQNDVMEMIYSVIKSMMDEVKATCQDEIKLLEVTMPEFPENPPQMKLKEAQKVLEDEYGEKGATKEPDFEPHQEKLMGEYTKKKFKSDFLFVTHYPVEKRPMYTMPDAEDPGYTMSFDLLFRGMEIVTGGQRIHDYDMLVESMKKFKLDPKDFEYYLMAFKYGMPPHGGIGMGLERVTWQLLGLDNIKQATLFPRDRVRIDEPLSKK